MSDLKPPVEESKLIKSISASFLSPNPTMNSKSRSKSESFLDVKKSGWTGIKNSLQIIIRGRMVSDNDKDVEKEVEVETKQDEILDLYFSSLNIRKV